MNNRSLLRLLSFISLMIVAIAASSLACYAQELPWKRGDDRGNGYNNSYGSPDGRRYQDPGQPYGASPQGQQDYGQAGRGGGGYDRGYDALRNNHRRPPAYRNNRPRYDDRAHSYGERTYQGDGSRGPYEGRPRTVPPRYGRSYNAPYPQQGYEPPAARAPGQAYAPPAVSSGRPYGQADRQRAEAQYDNGTYSDDEILEAGHRFFGKITKGLAKVIAHVFKKSGRPNAYILGEEGGGALIAGLRYGEGTIYTKAGDRRRVYWQGPSIGYDFGAEGAKTMILVYNLRNVDEIYERFAGVDGSAYLVGGVGVTFQKRGRVVLAPIRTGVGLRLGANIGYLKYTRRPTWNPF